ncbi:MAG: MSMEG_6728 family protein [Pseudomonadota bacterium]|nr:MSMEG_6728 family protein [Pseudomonadota bacterium]
MQTFLPYPSFGRSARALDDKRLGKQRVEVFQILNALAGTSKGWQSHPVVAMWRGYEDVLVLYGLQITREWTRRGHADSCLVKIAAFAPPEQRRPRALPPWLGDRAFHLSHQSALIRKDPERYGRLFPGVPMDLPYVWPIHLELA